MTDQPSTLQPNRHQGKVALVTGSGRGIGKVIALRLAQEGADVVINFFRNREPAEETAAEVRALGRRAELIRANIGEQEGLESLFSQIEEAYAGLDILVNNAASGYNRPIADQRMKGWDWTMNINARSALFAAQYALPLMQKRGGGSIVNISSPGSFRVLPEYVNVGASKAALEAITRYMAVEFGEHNIVVNAVSPGMVATDALKYFPEMQEILDVSLAKTAEYVPAKRNVQPEDVAGVVSFLCTPEAYMIRGQVILLDGGFTLRY